MREYVVVIADHTYEVFVRGAGESLRIEVGGKAHEVEIHPWVGTTHFRLLVDGQPQTMVVRRQGEDFLVTLAEEQYRIHVSPKLPAAGKGAEGPSGPRMREVAAPMPGLIVSVEVAPGDRITQGRPLAIMEAMKMQMEIRAPMTGTVRSVRVRGGQEVSVGAILVTLEAI